MNDDEENLTEALFQSRPRPRFVPLTGDGLRFVQVDDAILVYRTKLSILAAGVHDGGVVAGVAVPYDGAAPRLIGRSAAVDGGDAIGPLLGR